MISVPAGFFLGPEPVCKGCLPGIAIYILSSPQANLAHRIYSSFSHLHSVFFYLAWFELPSGFQYSVLGAANLAAERRDPQMVTQGLGHKSQAGLGWVCVSPTSLGS